MGFHFNYSINCWAAFSLAKKKWKEVFAHLCNMTVREKKEETRCFDFKEDMAPSAQPEWEVPARQSVNTLPLNHGATYWSTQMKSVSFFPDHKLIKNPLCWHQTVWHKLKLIRNWVCIDFYPAFAGYIRAWLVSFCSGVYSKCNPCSGLPVQRACSKKNKKTLARTLFPPPHQCAGTDAGRFPSCFRAKWAWLQEKMAAERRQSSQIWRSWHQ